MTHLKLALIGLTLLLAPSVALAQGSGVPRTNGSDFSVTRSVKGIIVDMSLEEGLVLVENKKGERFVAKVTKDTKFKADKKTELRALAEAKELALEHFKVGHAVQMRFRAADGSMRELKLRRT